MRVILFTGKGGVGKTSVGQVAGNSGVVCTSKCSGRDIIHIWHLIT